MSEATPRVDATLLEKFSNRTVRIVGKVVRLHGETATIDANGQVNVILNMESHLTTDHTVEVIGRVMNDLSVKVLMSTDLGTNIDASATQAVVDATHRFPSLFYQDEE